jgi:hypothetical protein
MDVSIEECLKRDQERGKHANAVGKDVILRMFYQHMCQQYAHDASKIQAVICDIDGTLAKMNDRGPFEWDKVGNDLPVLPVMMVINALYEAGLKIILLSGRDACCAAQTTTWLNKYRVPYHELHMREEGNMEADTIIKLGLYNEHVRDEYDVLAVFDDRPCMVRMWRQLGLYVFDCGNGIEF